MTSIARMFDRLSGSASLMFRGPRLWPRSLTSLIDEVSRLREQVALSSADAAADKVLAGVSPGRTTSPQSSFSSGDAHGLKDTAVNTSPAPANESSRCTPIPRKRRAHAADALSVVSAAEKTYRDVGEHARRLSGTTAVSRISAALNPANPASGQSPHWSTPPPTRPPDGPLRRTR